MTLQETYLGPYHTFKMEVFAKKKLTAKSH